MNDRLTYIMGGCFVALIFLTIIFITTILPSATFQPAPSKAAVSYTAQELRGRNIYRREGCFYCHSQFTRYQDWEGGELSQAGDYINETPHVLGTERTGPDLSNIGGKYASAWHVAHHLDPRKVKPGSIMPSFSHLSQDEMTDLVAYLQTIGSKRKIPNWIMPPQEIRDHYALISEKVDVNSSAAANAGRGIYMQNCSQCHGMAGRGNGSVSMTMVKKPANLTRSFYKAYSDDMWYYRIAHGVAGSRMPRWQKSLSDESMLYLTAFVKTLPQSSDTPSGRVDVVSFSQLDAPEALSHNFNQINNLNPSHHNKESRYIYGYGRPYGGH
ncbi:MAG: cbb3-type cytochrome c oxidase subunit II [Vampirovibrionales bacterium]|nr:cbb3-type cytochrome c oxidase subunit II [Vampirovibrionales bacterium]